MTRQVVARRWIHRFQPGAFLCLVLGWVNCVVAASDERIARIAVIANPYMTDLPPESIRDENGRQRSFIATNSVKGIASSVHLVNQIQPDAAIVFGSLTWSGSDPDCEKALQSLNEIEAPWYSMPGHRDQPETYRRHFSEHDKSLGFHDVRGVALLFAPDLHATPEVATQRIKMQLGQLASRPKAVLLLGDHSGHGVRSKLTSANSAFWQLVEQQDVSALLEPTRYGHQVRYANSLPIWTVGSTGWSGAAGVTIADVFPNRVELRHVSDPQRRSFSLEVPNTTNVDRLATLDEDPYRCPSYSLDVAEDPKLTFALVSDPQFDREKNREYLIEKATAAIVELNQLKPGMVFVAGDLVNNNLPEEWELFKTVFSRLETDYHVVPGNHDVLFNYEFVESSYASAPQRRPDYAAIVQTAMKSAAEEGFQGPAALYEKYTGSKPRQLIELGDYAFVTVPFLTMRADDEQIEFLRSQLSQTVGKTHVFVIAHYPSLPAFGNNLQPQLGGDAVLSLLHEHRVTGYLFGHRHRNGFRMHQRTAHILADNMLTIHLFFVFDDRVVVGRKRVGAPLYEKTVIVSPRR